MGRSQTTDPGLTEPMVVALHVTHALEALGVAYFIGGSLASAVHGVARATLDVDVVADLDERHAEPLARAIEERFYVDLEAIRQAIRRRRSFNVIHLETMFKVDVFVSRRTAYADQQFRRRVAEVVADRPREAAYFASREDIVLAKLEWYRMGSAVSDRQWQDVLGVLRAQGARLDWGYMRDWARDQGLEDLLDRARREARSA